MFRFLIVSILLGVTAAQICPPAEILLPCTCTESTKRIECRYIHGRFDIKAVFDNVSALVSEDTIFNELVIRETTLFDLPAGSIKDLKFLKIDISENLGLDYISPDAFNATYSVTKDLSLWNNPVPNAAPYERDIFDFMSKFTNVEKIWIPSNRLTSVPDNAFGPLPKLANLYLGGNDIATIGASAFAQLPKLTKIYLSNNNIPSDGISPDAFKGVRSDLDIDLEDNDMDFVGESSFKPLLDQALKVVVGGSTCGHFGCSYTYLTCDERADWICENQALYEPKLSGFLCTDQALVDVWGYCVNGTRSVSNLK